MLTHLDERGRPRMVDVGGKAPSRRTAWARAVVTFPEDAAAKLTADGFATSKGPVFQTAIVAGVMATKRTHELIPFCHPLALEDCSIAIDMDGCDAVIERTWTRRADRYSELRALDAPHRSEQRIEMYYIGG